MEQRTVSSWKDIPVDYTGIIHFKQDDFGSKLTKTAFFKDGLLHNLKGRATIYYNNAGGEYWINGKFIGDQKKIGSLESFLLYVNLMKLKGMV